MKTITILAVSLLVMGCGASRKAVKIDTHQAVEIEQTREAETFTESQETIATTAELSQDERVVTLVEKFDTTLPVDLQTGTPPLKRRITQARETATTVSQEQVAEAAASSHSTEQEATSIAAQADDKSESVTRRNFPWWVVVVGAIGITALVWAARKKLSLIRK
ncbi:MAG: hypothetical protein LUF04_16210 [Bacteroides sp.]|nr:hypothetical protein [Bacteroides sp.]